VFDEVLTFRAISYDSAALPGGVTDSGGGFLVTNQSERDIVGWLFSEIHIRSLIFEEMALPRDARTWFGVAEPLTRPGHKPGDLDVLVCRRDTPHQPTAIEAKCIKVRAETDDDDSVNRFEKLKRAVAQSNGLQVLGFHESYLCIVCLVDARAHAVASLPFREMSQRTFLRIYHFLEDAKLNRDVGILLVEVAQPSEKGFERAANINVCRVRPAAKREQPSALTERVSAFVRHPR
jgi:hypothetical protein